MPIPFITVCTVSRPLFSPVLVCFLFILFLLPHGHHGAQANSYKNKEINIGVIIDVNSSIGKEEQTAMIIAAQNEAPKGRNLSLHFLDSYRDPQQVASAGELICFTTFFFFFFWFLLLLLLFDLSMYAWDMIKLFEMDNMLAWFLSIEYTFPLRTKMSETYSFGTRVTYKKKHRWEIHN